MKLATSIEVKGGDKGVSSALRQAWRAQSCSADLEQAQGACDALAQVTKAADGIDPLALLYVQSGLLMTAILLYARATATSGSKSRSEEHTSELQSLMRISYAVFCLKK